MGNAIKWSAVALVVMGLTGCASFGDSLSTFNDKFDRFNQEYERQVYLQQQESRSKQSWGIVQSVRLVERASFVQGERPRQMQELQVRMTGRSNDFRVVYVPLESAPYRPGAVIHLQ